MAGGWSQPVPVDDGATPMALRIFSFPFDPAFDATDWLHSHLARSTLRRSDKMIVNRLRTPHDEF